MKIALVQMHIDGDIRQNLTRAETLCAEAKKRGGGVIVFSELFSTGFPPDRAAELAPVWGPETRRVLEKMALKYHITIIAGCGDPFKTGKFFNSALVFSDTGQCITTYHKIHLFSYGHEDRYVIPGTEPVIFSVEGYPAGVFICYDLRFPEDFRKIAPHVSMIFVIANWPEQRRDHWVCLLKARAIENQCWIIGVNRTGTDSSGLRYSGDSMVVDPLGTVLYHMNAEESVKIVTINPEESLSVRKAYPFLSV